MYNYLTFDDLIFKIQKFGGASTYWGEVTSLIPHILPVNLGVNHVSGSRYSRILTPKSDSKIFHSSHFRVSKPGNAINIITVYDLIYEHNMVDGFGALLNKFERKKSILRADGIICISHSTKNDLLNYYGKLLNGKSIEVIHLGCKVPDLDFNFSAKSLVKKMDYFLYVGGRAGYKNFKLFANAFSLGNFFADGFNVICTGARFTDEEMQILIDLKINRAFHNVGLVDSAQLSVLYRQATALVYPSLYEGFGLPILEAMANDCPVICTNVSSLPEVAGSSAILIEPSSIDSLVAAMEEILDVDKRNFYIGLGKKRALEFTWKKTAIEHCNFYKKLYPF